MDAVRVELQRRVDVVVDDERDAALPAELAKGSARLHELGRGSSAEPKLHDRRPALDGYARGVQLGNEGVELHASVIRARSPSAAAPRL
jgi:hypothetical protein